MKIDPELRGLLAPLAAEEREHLEASIARDGCIHSLVVWNGTLLDGHHRFEICNRLGLPFDTKEIPFPDRGAAMKWIVGHQNARRNQTLYEKAETALRLEAALRPAAEARMRKGRVDPVPNSGEGRVDDQIAKAVGVARDTVHRVRYLRDRADDFTRERLRRGVTTINGEYVRLRNDVRRRAREEERQADAQRLGRVSSLEDLIASGVRFPCIVIDPPWPGPGDLRGGAPYPTMTLDQIRALPVGMLAAPDAHLYLWITNRHVIDGTAKALLDAGGFRYENLITWCKPGLGVDPHYFRTNTEHVIFAVKGSLPIEPRDVGTWFTAPRGAHSEKPDAFYALVERCSPGPYIDLFARKERPGWTVWGNVAPGQPGPDLTPGQLMSTV